MNFENNILPLFTGCTSKNFKVAGVHSPDTISLINTAIPAISKPNPKKLHTFFKKENPLYSHSCIGLILLSFKYL